MHRLIKIALASVAIVGGASLAQGAQAQSYGDYRYNDGYYSRNYAPGYDYYRGEPSYVAPGYDSSAAAAGAVIGSMLGIDPAYGGRYDRYGYDPNGMIAADGHRVKCKIRTLWDAHYGRYIERRFCE